MLPCTRRVTRHLQSTAARSRCSNLHAYQSRFPPIVAAGATATSLPAPSLLFLYPRAFCVSSTRSQSQASLSSAAPTGEASDDGPSTTTTSPPRPTALRATTSQASPESEAERVHGYMPITVNNHVPTSPPSHGSGVTTISQHIVRSQSSTHSIESSQVPEAIKAKSRRRERSRYIQWLRQLVFASNAAWHELIILLCHLSIHVDHTAGHHLVVTDAFITHLTGDQRSNRWYQPQGTGSVVRLLPSQYSNPGSRLLLLNGTDRAVELAGLHINRLQSEFHLHQPHRDIQPDLQHPSPPDLTFHSVNSSSTFIQFIVQITTRSVQRGVARDSERSWSQDVASILILLFQNSDTSKFASTVALNEALLFLCKHPDLSDEVDVLHERAIALHKGFDTSTANILLAFAFNTNDFTRAKSLLHKMRQFGTPASSYTWSLFFAKTKSELKVRVLKLMKERDLVPSPRAMTTIINSVLHGLSSTVKPGLSGVRDLLNQLDTLFNTKWMTVESYHSLLGLFRYSRPPLDTKTIHFLQQLPQDRNFSIDHQTTWRLMALDQVHGLTKATLDSFAKTLRDVDYPRLRLAVPLLFTAAWNRCFYNVCHVLWTYAAVRGLTSYVMEETVIRHLTRQSLTHSRTAMRGRLGARVIVGIQGWKPIETYALQPLYPKLSAHFADSPDPILWLGQQTPDPITRKEQLKLAHLTLENDINAWKLFCPMSLPYLETTLQSAFQLDEQWVKDGKVDIQDDAAILELRDQRQRINLKRLEVGKVNEKVAKRLGHMKILRSALKIAGEERVNGGDFDENGLLTNEGDQSQAVRDRDKPWWIL